MSKDLEKRIEELKDLEQEIKNMIDRGEIVKPDSGNFVRDILQTIEKHIVDRQPGLKARTEVNMIGSSGNWWKPDIVIEDTEIEDRTSEPTVHKSFTFFKIRISRGGMRRDGHFSLKCGK